MGRSSNSHRQRSSRSSSRRNSHEQDYFQPVGVEGTFTRVLKLFGKHWKVFLGINFITSLLSFCLVMISFIAMAAIFLEQQMKMMEDGDGGGEDGDNNNDNDVDQETMFLVVAPAILVELFIIFLIQAISEAATVQAVAEVYAGQAPSIGSCLCKACRKLCSLLGSGFLIVFCFVLIPGALITWLVADSMVEGNETENYVLFAAFGFVYVVFVTVVLLLTYHVYPAIMVERNGPIGAIIRSMQLVTDNFCYTFCSLLLWLVTKFLINSLVTSLTNNGNPTNIVSSEDGSFQVDLTFGSAGDGALAFVAGIFTSAIGSIIQSVIYFNNRVQMEHLTTELLCNEMQLDPPLLTGSASPSQRSLSSRRRRRQRDIEADENNNNNTDNNNTETANTEVEPAEGETTTNNNYQMMEAPASPTRSMLV